MFFMQLSVKHTAKTIPFQFCLSKELPFLGVFNFDTSKNLINVIITS